MLEYLDIAIGFATVMLLLSLVVTAIVQAISTLLDLRGNNLVWALAKLFDQVPIPSMSANGTTADGKQKKVSVSTELAAAVAGHPSITITQHRFLGVWQRAKAIRAEELKNVVHSLAEAPPKDMSEQAKAALKRLVEREVPGSGEALVEARHLANQLEPFLAEHGRAVRDAIDELRGRTRLIGAEIATWFDTVMDRSTDRFARNSKLWSVAVGAVIAFTFQVDAVSVFKQISKNAGVRSQLVAMAQPALEQAKQIEAYANVAGSTFEQMKQEDAYKASLAEAPVSLARCPDGDAWIAKKAPGDKALLAAFHARCETRGAAAVGALPKQIQALQQTVDQTQLKLFGQWWVDPFGWAEFFGCLVTVVLLALGGPFWFNVLRQLSTLRPPTSQKITDDKAAGAEQKAARPAPART